jgi:galactose-1-phosphate uridylyltransferase
MERDRVPEEWFEVAVRFPDVSRCRSLDLYRVAVNDPEIGKGRPSAVAALDPRSGLRVVHSPAREHRPNDHPPSPPAPAPGSCIVCEGKTTQVIDVADLSEGKTFINFNHFPLVYPLMTAPFREISRTGPSRQSTGIHLLQWTSSLHDRDLHNMPPEDIAVVLSRLAALESTLYRGGGGMPEVRDGRHGHVAIIKNVGRNVGGSVAHGHQQIVHTNIRPLALGLDRDYELKVGEAFAETLCRHSPDALVVRDYGDWFRTLVPWYMRRPLEMAIVCQKAGVKDLEDLDEEGTFALAAALRDAAEAVTGLMPQMGREVAWNLLFHNGIAEGLYVELLPYTQEWGGYEGLGICLCSGSPEASVDAIRGFLKARDEGENAP